MFLSDLVKGRDNNFFLIRIIAAFTVLFVHSHILVALAPGETRDEPLWLNLGACAVHIFFFTSGFFITGSLLSRASIVDYAWARFLRIFPALWLMLLVTAVALGFFVGTLPAGEFFSSPVTHDYFLRCATLIRGMRFFLPGVFENNPYPHAVNGSLWTLPVEWRMYEYLAVAWAVFALAPSWRMRAFRIGFPLAAFALASLAIASYLTHGVRDDGQVGVAEFFVGSALYVWRDQIKLSHARGALLCGALALAALDARAFFAVYVFALGPLVLHLAYLFGGWIRNFNRLGDYSYGVYIYAFPVQQSLVALIPGLSLAWLNACASLITLALAVLSWHLVEKPALDRKFAAATATHRLLGRWGDGFAALRRRIATGAAPPR